VVAGRFVHHGSRVDAPLPLAQPHDAAGAHATLLAGPDVLGSVGADDLDGRAGVDGEVDEDVGVADAQPPGIDANRAAPEEARALAQPLGLGVPDRPEALRERTDVHDAGAQLHVRVVDAGVAPALERPSAPKQRHRRGRKRQVVRSAGAGAAPGDTL
jgi:hypothetical protein